MSLNESNEAKIICQMLISNSIIPSITLTQDHFKDHLCRKAFNEIQAQYTKHGGVSNEALYDIGLEYDWVYEVRNLIPTSANFPFFEQKIKASYQHDYEQRLLEESVQRFESGEGIIPFLEEKITNFTAQTGTFSDTNLQDVLLSAQTDIEQRIARGGALPGITTGIGRLNAMIHGWEKRQYYIIGARPSDGKTAFGINCVLSAAKGGFRPGFITAESSVKEIGRRIFARESRIDASRIAMGRLGPKDTEELINAGSRLVEKNVVFYDEPNPTIETVERKAREWKRRENVDIIFIDYVQIIQGGKGDSQHQKLADISLRLKALARTLDIPIVCMAQLIRGAADRKPMESDVAGTDQITRDADGIILIYHERNSFGQIVESQLIVAKARDGKKGICGVTFEGQFLSFSDEVVKKDEPAAEEKKEDKGLFD